jgi:calcineurin-like phosphoesterase
MEKLPYVLRPENLNPQAPGIGARIFKVGNEKIAVTVLLGQRGFDRVHGENPFARLPPLLERLRQETPSVIVDFHAGATGEKHTLFAAADGKCSAVIGSHTRVQTADAAILGGGTAVITDAGRTGSAESVGGMEIAGRIQEYRSGIPDWSREAWIRPELQGVLIDLDRTGKAVSIECITCAAPALPDPPVRKEPPDAAPAEEDGEGS